MKPSTRAVALGLLCVLSNGASATDGAPHIELDASQPCAPPDDYNDLSSWFSSDEDVPGTSVEQR